MMTELDKLEEYLKANGYEYERIDEEGSTFAPMFNRHQIYVYKDGEVDWDVICHYGSYGYKEGLLEIYGNIVRGDLKDGVEGWLTADEIIERLVSEKIKQFIKTY